MGDKPLQNKDKKFSIIKNIAINKKIYCMIEADGNYIITASSQTKSIKFFDINYEFKEKSESEIKNIKVIIGNNTMTIIPNKKILIVACENGFNIISIQNLKNYRFIHCKYEVLSK